ncbi:MAG: EAL domain-containing protein [Aliidongia sp.]
MPGRFCSRIASICEDLGLEMVAEGVETNAQLKIVRDANIGTMQGYLISRPPARRQIRRVAAGHAEVGPGLSALLHRGRE